METLNFKSIATQTVVDRRQKILNQKNTAIKREGDSQD